MPMMGQFQNRTGWKLMPLPASRIYVPRQFDLLSTIGQSQTNTGVVDETVQAVQIFALCRTAERGGPDLFLPPQQFLMAALFYDAAVLHHQDQVRAPYGREPVVFCNS